MKRKFDFKCGLLLLICLSILFTAMDTPLLAQTRRAFLVGINHYELPAHMPLPQCRKEGLANLLGCLNDVEAMKGLLQSRFQFEGENIRVLTNQDATREGILRDFKKYLIQEVSPGDTCLFYFAGHGSWMTNSLSPESNKRDESLVPFDWYTGNPDIRDKELKILFNEVLDKKARLTVIVDACHSGSISRGIQERHYREAPPNLCDAAEPPDGKKDPSSRGALILAAAQEFQLASEIKDEYDRYRGLFSWALITVLRDSSANEAIGHIMQRVDARMQSEGRQQAVRLHYPTIEARDELRKRPLFEIKTGEDGGMVFAVEAVKGKRLTLQGGFAAGIREKCTLQKMGTDNGDGVILVEVTRVTGLNRCEAKVLAGDGKKIKSGDLFKIHTWVAPGETRMKVWMPVAPYSLEELIAFTTKINVLKKGDDLLWVQDPTKQKPTHTLYWDNSSWQLQPAGKKRVGLGKQPAPAQILQAIGAHPALANGKPSLFVQLPLSASLYKTIMAQMKDFKEAVDILSAKEEVIYMLAGREVNGTIEYGWRIPDVMEDKERGFALPVGTDWLQATESGDGLKTAAGQLAGLLLHLVKVRGWMQLQSPSPTRGENGFPYQLVLKNSLTGEYKTTGPLVGGETYGLVLRATGDMAGIKKEHRFVYVFLIDSRGDSTLLFPHKDRFSVENFFPDTETWPAEFGVGEKDLFNITPPFGLDTYILLTTAERISNPEVLEFKGIRGGEKRGAAGSLLERLLYDLSSGTRSGGQATLVNWSIQRLGILSVERK